MRLFMEWKKAPEDLVQFIAKKMKDIECDYRKMFGYPAYFINGNMFAGVFGDKIFIRLSDSDIEKIRREPRDISPFEPMKGRPMKEYVFLPKSEYSDDAFFDEWLKKSVLYVSSLPPKKKKK
jgi:TfoX/Sxy family transcriptional regulator of competence genes